MGRLADFIELFLFFFFFETSLYSVKHRSAYHERRDTEEIVMYTEKGLQYYLGRKVFQLLSL